MLGNLYCGNVKEAIRHYTKKYRKKPIAIYCNKDEFQNIELIRNTGLRWPRNNFVLSHRIEEK